MVGYKWVVGGDGVGEDDSAVERIGGSRIDGIAGDDEYYEDERVDPCVVKGEGFPASEEAFCFSSFGEGPERFGWGDSRASLFGLIEGLLEGSDGYLLASREENGTLVWARGWRALMPQYLLEDLLRDCQISGAVEALSTSANAR